jgi:D-alanine-D-alanine ligase-like ATP-grasp enzyme
MIFFNPLKVLGFAKEYGFPLVIKPNVSGFSRGSHFPITTYKELLIAAFIVKVWWPSSVIEQYLKGSNYRVVVVKDDIMSIIKRYPPFVDGDGVNDISTLIDIENNRRKEMKLYPVIHPIKKNKKISKHLARQNLTFQSVPVAGQRITLQNKISLAPGGVVEVVKKEEIHGDNRELFLKILPLFQANILGIDAIFETGIEKSFKDQHTIFLEVNSRPYLKMHDFPRFGEKEDLHRYYKDLDELEVTQDDVF